MSTTIFSLLLGGAAFIATSIFQLNLVSIVFHTRNRCDTILSETKLIMLSSTMRKFNNICFFSSVAAMKIFSSFPINFTNLFLMLTAASVGFLGVFLITFCATNISLHLLKISDLAYRSMWYEYPPKLQRQIRFIIQNAQRPKAYTGLNVMICNLNSFTKVTKRLFQKKYGKKYFLVFFFVYLACRS